MSKDKKSSKEEEEIRRKERRNRELKERWELKRDIKEKSKNKK